GAERDLAAVADEDVQPQGGQRQDQEGNQDRAKQVVRRGEGHDDEGDRQQRQDRDTVLQDREDLLVGAVGGLELAVLAVKHGRSPSYTRSMIFSPNKPCGRTSRNIKA